MPRPILEPAPPGGGGNATLPPHHKHRRPQPSQRPATAYGRLDNQRQRHRSPRNHSNSSNNSIGKTSPPSLAAFQDADTDQFLTAPTNVASAALRKAASAQCPPLLRLPPPARNQPVSNAQSPTRKRKTSTDSLHTLEQRQRQRVHRPYPPNHNSVGHHLPQQQQQPQKRAPPLQKPPQPLDIARERQGPPERGGGGTVSFSRSSSNAVYAAAAPLARRRRQDDFATPGNVGRDKQPIAVLQQRPPSSSGHSSDAFANDQLQQQQQPALSKKFTMRSLNQPIPRKTNSSSNNDNGQKKKEKDDKVVDLCDDDDSVTVNGDRLTTASSTTTESTTTSSTVEAAVRSSRDTNSTLSSKRQRHPDADVSPPPPSSRDSILLLFDHEAPSSASTTATTTTTTTTTNTTNTSSKKKKNERPIEIDAPELPNENDNSASHRWAVSVDRPAHNSTPIKRQLRSSSGTETSTRLLQSSPKNVDDDLLDIDVDDEPHDDRSKADQVNGDRNLGSLHPTTRSAKISAQVPAPNELMDTDEDDDDVAHDKAQRASAENAVQFVHDIEDDNVTSLVIASVVAARENPICVDDDEPPPACCGLAALGHTKRSSLLLRKHVTSPVRPLGGGNQGKRRGGKFGGKGTRGTAIRPGSTFGNFTNRDEDQDWIPETGKQATADTTKLDRKHDHATKKVIKQHIRKDSVDFDSADSHSDCEKPAARSTNRTTRSSVGKKEASVIEIPSSEDESTKQLTPPVARKIRVKADAVRVAVGKNVFRLECGIAFDSKSTNLTIRYKKGDRRLTRNLNLTSSSAEEYVTHTIRLSEDLEELKFYSQTCDDELEELDGDECEVIHFLSMRVKKKEDNGLKVLSNTYKPEGSDLERKYIVVEFRSEKEFNDVRQAMIKDVTLAAFFSEESRLTAVEARTYCKALVEDGWREKSKSLLAKSKSCFLAGKGENDVLLVYPFGADAKEIDNSASGLRELGCVLIAKPTSAASADFTKEDCDHKSKALFCDTDTAKPDSSSEKENDVEDQNDETKDDPGDESRAVLEFSVSTFERLVPGVYLNDTLIDFWCQWIWRNTEKSDIHSFTTLFFTTLESEGPDGVSRWTMKRGVNIFQKKFIFIPINKSLHWSLCVVVNPGAILDHCHALTTVMSEDIDECRSRFDDNRFPCLLFFDALKAHRKNRVAKIVREWLNSEWARLNPGHATKVSFDSVSMKIYSPKVPYQENSWDCGVYVCRYFFAMYLLRSRMFSYKESDYFTTPSSLFNNLITESEEFNFNADDIIRIREEMRELLERLSIIYMPWKVEQDRKRAAKRRAEKPDKTRPKDAKLKENSNANNTCEHTQSRKFVTSSSGVQSLDMDITTDHSVGLSPSALKTDEPSLHFMLMNPAVGGNLELTFAAHVARPPPKAYLSQVEEVERNDFKSPSSARKPVIEQRVDRPGSRHEVEIDECSTEDI